VFVARAPSETQPIKRIISENMERRLVSVDELHPSGFMTSSYVLDANTSRKPSKVVETDLGDTVVGCPREPVRRLRPVVSLLMTSNVG
jgi:hypothetical protein